MKIMGLPNWLHWTAWFLKVFFFLLISIILMVIMLKVSWYSDTDVSVFTHTNGLVLFVFLIFYMFATITFCFAVSVFFSKGIVGELPKSLDISFDFAANTAATIAGLAWFLSYAPYLFIQDRYHDLTLAQKLFSCLGSNTAMAFGFQLMLMFEGTGDGISTLLLVFCVISCIFKDLEEIKQTILRTKF